MPFRFPVLLTLLFAGAIFALASWAYFPGLQGGFLFDDFGNLPTLGASGPVDNWATFLRYITSGGADPTGRPLALLSFLLDARDWPAQPYPFKRTNLLLHLLNGALLMLLLRQLGRARTHCRPSGGAGTLPAPRNRTMDLQIDLAAVLGSAFWLLHPLLVSTTLYIVQREAMLPATFTLLGLLLWMRGRHGVLQGQRIAGLIWITLGLGVCTLLGVLCKANGILLPALALIIEYVWLAPRITTSEPSSAGMSDPSRKARCTLYSRTMLLMAWLPTALTASYLMQSGWNGFVHGVSAVRPWTMGQRLLTETRVLMNYLDLLWLPRPFTPGLFNDHIQVSVSLWSPIATLPALIAVLGLIAGAWLWRRKFPALALAILFYFVGQSLESTTVPLELYFEHRNYLPAMLMFWPLALWLCGVTFSDGHAVAIHGRGSTAKRLDPIEILKALFILVVLSGLALMTHAGAALWGNTLDQALLWARLNPESPRAQTNAAQLEMSWGQPQHAIARLEAALPADPDQVQLAFNLIGAHCALGAVGERDLELARHAMAQTRDPGTLLVHWFESSIAAATTTAGCHGLDLSALESLLDAGLSNPRLLDVHGRKQDLLNLKGQIALARHEPAIALQDFNAALDLDVRAGAALNRAALLGSAGYPREGLAHLDHYQSMQDQAARPDFGMPRIHAWILQRQRYWQKEIARLRNTLREDAENEAKGHE